MTLTLSREIILDLSLSKELSTHKWSVDNYNKFTNNIE